MVIEQETGLVYTNIISAFSPYTVRRHSQSLFRSTRAFQTNQSINLDYVNVLEPDRR